MFEIMNGQLDLEYLKLAAPRQALIEHEYSFDVNIWKYKENQ